MINSENHSYNAAQLFTSYIVIYLQIIIAALGKKTKSNMYREKWCNNSINFKPR